jgi:hypothetical protein
MTCMTISFFGNHGPEMDLEDQVADEDTVATLANLGDGLVERLRFISRTTESRLDSGWCLAKEDCASSCCTRSAPSMRR